MSHQKRALIFICSFLFFFFLNQVSAVIGVSPALYEVEFKPGLKQVFPFRFINDPDMVLQVYTEGDLAQYVELSTVQITGAGGVNALLELPDKIETPGTHYLFIGGRQVGLVNSPGGLAIVGDARGVIMVKVPYEGKYATLDFGATSANAGHPIDLVLTIKNLGLEELLTGASVTIYSGENQPLQTVIFDVQKLVPNEVKVLTHTLDTSNYTAGRYRAVAEITYEDKTVNKEGFFRLGELYVNISNYTSVVARNKINQFDIIAESYWNDPIDQIYANVSIPAYNIRFTTPSSSITGFGKTTLSGFFDTTTVSEDTFQATIQLNYGSKTTVKDVTISFEKELNYLLVGLAIGAVLIAIIALYLFIRARRLSNASENKKKV